MRSSKLQPNNVLEWAALKMNLFPRPLFDIGHALVQYQCILTATRCGIFTALLHQPKALNTLAKECKADAGVLLLLLRVLISCDYVIEKNDQYQISKKMKKWVDEESATSVTNNILLGETQLSILGQLDEILKTGKAIDMHSTFTSKSYWKVYQAAMLELAKLTADAIKGKRPIKKDTDLLLDIGGSHGILGAAICRENGIKKSIVLDLPQAIEFSKPLAKRESIDDIVEFQACNILEQPINMRSDVILMASFLHHFNEEDILSILKKAYDSLTEDGTIIILDFTSNSNRNKDCLIASASLFFRLTSNSVCFSGDDYRRFLHSSGFNDISIKNLFNPPSYQLITARKN